MRCTDILAFIMSKRRKIQEMITSEITHKKYEPSTALYFSNPIQCQRYLQYLGTEFFLDIIYSSEKRPDALIFVWKRCPETARAKELWDQHLL
jgi:hypothetical protein